MTMWANHLEANIGKTITTGITASGETQQMTTGDELMKPDEGKDHKPRNEQRDENPATPKAPVVDKPTRKRTGQSANEQMGMGRVKRRARTDPSSCEKPKEKSRKPQHVEPLPSIKGAGEGGIFAKHGDFSKSSSAQADDEIEEIHSVSSKEGTDELAGKGLLILKYSLGTEIDLSSSIQDLDDLESNLFTASGTIDETSVLSVIKELKANLTRARTGVRRITGLSHQGEGLDKTYKEVLLQRFAAGSLYKALQSDKTQPQFHPLPNRCPPLAIQEQRR
jgi:hypothetical protein